MRGSASPFVSEDINAPFTLTPADVGHNLVPWGDEDGACVHCTLTACLSQQLRRQRAGRRQG